VEVEPARIFMIKNNEGGVYQIPMKENNGVPLSPVKKINFSFLLNGSVSVP